MDAHANSGWADRLGPSTRLRLIAVTTIVAFLMIGMVAGVGYAVYEDGELPTKPAVYVIFAAIVAVTAVVGWTLAKLVRSLSSQPMSNFDRRYWKMWAGVFGLSLVIGVIVAAVGLNSQASGLSLMLSNAPIAPMTAVIVAIALTILLALAAIYYHRTVDDHEERAYLWGSTLAFYFLIVVFPLHWLLARGGLVPSLTIGIALLIVLASTVLQAIVWAIIKFR
jgi:hypothetical protein